MLIDNNWRKGMYFRHQGEKRVQRNVYCIPVLIICMEFYILLLILQKKNITFANYYETTFVKN